MAAGVIKNEKTFLWGDWLRTVKQFVQHSFWLIEISAKDICKHSWKWMDAGAALVVVKWLQRIRCDVLLWPGGGN